jgi:hypothetical protein
MSDIPINPVTRRVQFTGNTGLGPFAFTFNIYVASDIAVYRNAVLLTLTTDYTVTIAANGTGSVTLTGSGSGTTLTLNDSLTIVGARQLARTTDFVTAGDLLAVSLNEQLDSNVIMSQQLDEKIDRSIKFDQFDTYTTATLPAAAARASKILAFDVNGDIDVALASDFFGNAILGANYVTNTATGDGSQVAFGLTVSPGSKNNIQVYIDGVYQNKASFSISAATITFSEAPPLNSAIEFIIGQAVTEISGDSDSINYTQGGTGSQQRTVTSKLQESVSVKDFGAVGNGVADDTAAIQAAWNAIKGANGTLVFPSGTYRCDSALDLRVTYSSQNHFHSIVGESATIDFSNTILTSGNMIIFGSGVGLFEEKSRFTLEGLHLIGPSLGTITANSTPPHTLVGISFDYAINLYLNNVLTSNFYVGYKANFTFPIVATAIESDNCYIGLQLVGDVTCSSWVGCSFKEGRFGVVIQPDSGKTVYGQTFIRCNVEGNQVGVVIDPLDGSGVGVWDIDFIDPYMEAITFDGFRIGRAVNLSDASVLGADRTNGVNNIKISGGLWDGQWGVATHQPVLFHAADTVNAPAGILVNIPVQLSTASIGYTRKSQLKNTLDNFIGQGTVIQDEYQYEIEATSIAVGHVQFPAIQVPSANANALDDYEEGIWAPTLTFATAGDQSIAYSYQNGYYTKIGDTVTAHIDLLTTTFTHTTASGILKISLPIAINASNVPVGSGVFQGWAGLTYLPVLQGSNGEAFAEIRASRSGSAPVTLGASDFATGGTVRITATLVYKV